MKTKIFYTSVKLHLHENVEKFRVLEKLIIKKTIGFLCMTPSKINVYKPDDIILNVLE